MTIFVCNLDLSTTTLGNVFEDDESKVKVLLKDYLKIIHQKKNPDWSNLDLMLSDSPAKIKKILFPEDGGDYEVSDGENSPLNTQFSPLIDPNDGKITTTPQTPEETEGFFNFN